MYCYWLLPLLACATASVHAQTSRLIVEVSSDAGATWATEVAANPGQRVHVRTICEVVSAEPFTGLSHVTYRLTLAGLDASDAVAPFEWVLAARSMGTVPSAMLVLGAAARPASPDRTSANL